MPEKSAHQTRAMIALLVLAIIWGYNWVVMKVALQYSTASQFAAMRTLGGGLFLLALLAAMKKPLRPREIPSTIVLGLLQTTGFTGFIIWALVSGAAGKTSVLSFTMPFWVLLLAWPMLGERIRGMQWGAVALALIGLVCILEPWRMHGSMHSTILAVLAGVSWALSVVFHKKLTRRVPDLDLLSFTTWQMLFGSVPIVLFALGDLDQPIQWTPSYTVAIIYSVVLANALGWMAWLYALQRLPAGVASMSSMLIPVIAVLAAWLQLGERPSPQEATGMVCIIAALLLISWVSIRRHERVDAAMGQD
ncbi:MAG TPA: DMT family transporter [Methylophilaceae bacterium]|nr:DMT family transporter [Methylophilaceae bacterium]HQR60567.1 DMT family transporter [Methylophilaceae bacterium]